MTHLYKHEILFFREIITGKSECNRSAGWIAEQGEFVDGGTCSSTGWGWLICTSTQYDSEVNLGWDKTIFTGLPPYEWNTLLSLPGRWICNFTDPKWLICTSMKLTQQSIWDERRRFSPVCRHMSGTPQSVGGEGRIYVSSKRTQWGAFL